MKSGQIFFGLIFLLMAACPALAQEVGKIVSIVGTAEVLRKERWQSVSLHEALQPGDVVRTGPGGRLAVLLADGSQLKINANSQLLLKQIALPTRQVAMRLMQSLLRLFSGEIWVRSLAEPLKIETLAAVATIRGTELNLAVEPVEAARLTVVEGVVEFRNPQGSVLVAAKEQAIAKPGKAPRKVVIINPRDAVQWALYYPPLIDYHQVIYPEGPDAQAIRRALEHYRRGALPETLRSLEQVPPERRDARFFTLRAGLLLSVSQVAEAGADIAEALRRNPSEATAHALRSIIALVQNQKEKALRLARQAVELEPQLPVPQVALSYAYQATFDLEKALKSLEQAAKLAPEDALIQARLAELELSRGELERALKIARKAVGLDPELARTHTVLGFAYLTQTQIKKAKESFEKAIALDSADPLPRLGLGLAKIREGDLTEGTREIAIAASLDPNNSLIRSYLGKAYYEQKEDKLAVRELATAKGLDPRDPTPYFYDAIRKQTVNRPVEALQDLQKSIELNDNRAMYRSRLLLDEDVAARSANLAKIYDNLGFEQRARLEAWKSVNIDPTDFSAHRFLADSYATLQRQEIARVSELLQSQLLQPANISPLQPELAETNLAILEGAGPSQLSFNEFSPLFRRNNIAFQANVIAGNNGTVGDDLVISTIQGPFSGSFGQFHYETNGFRNNNDLSHDIYNLFGQLSFSNLSLQTELRYRETESGDVTLRFGSEDPNRRTQIKQRSDRLGAHYKFTSTQDLIASFIHTDAEDCVTDPSVVANQSLKFQTCSDTDAYHFEFQHMYHGNWFRSVAGFGYVNEDGERTTSFDFFDQSGNLASGTINSKEDKRHVNGYLYMPIDVFRSAAMILGVSYDSFEGLGIDKNVINPKFGFVWNLTSWTTFRAVAFRVLKRPFVSNQTIEPTQIAGFNQFFDDGSGSESKRYGVGLDQQIHRDLFTGIELSWRDVKDVILLQGVPRVEDHNETLYRGYVYWTIHPKLAFSTEYQYEELERDPIFASNRRDKLRTHYVPINFNYHSPNGFFASVGATYASQKINFQETIIQLTNEGPLASQIPRSDSDNFWVVDASIGYRLPKRHGLLSIEVRNLLDQDFEFESTFDIAGEIPHSPRFQPDRTIFARLNLWFY